MKLLETIKYQNGRFFNLKYHQERMDRSYLFTYNHNNPINLNRSLEESNLPLSQNPYKCRVTYDNNGHQIEFVKYEFPQINSLKLVVDDDIEYNIKYSNRTALENLFNRRGNADDIIIVKDGLITDSSYANLLFYNGKTWVTPAKPLLAGTQREYLLHKGIIDIDHIRPSHIINFKIVRMVNSMMSFEDKVDIKISDLVL
ncbi:MAG: hypothetical protein HN336_08660 [Lentimicrobiaceae bacterium]|mgnify:FL=1|jgi:4-amino-4-deoxychorismate lyase|nr:hypothetical protein [Lentimicrobiaceae bacterium]MCP4910137.1 hypothetical protein [Bacteroidota bacterium]MBT3454810.1 hypothetical protein [Lentimicrobiaceae bacterium]MBT3817809.1 hypothetical protein [Lentimicrobiaceae bacterium]MBT4061162.1 hypothetical protein [Lentimicrobiaceae bacterium]